MERRVLKRTAIEICASCPNQGQQGCKKAEIDSSKDGRITLPICMVERLGEVRLGQKNIFEYCPPTETKTTTETTTKPEIKPGQRNEWKGHFEPITQEPQKETKKPETPIRIQTVECTDAPLKNWDEVYTRILHCIKDHHTIGSMSKLLNIPRSTLRDRLTRLEKKEIITGTETHLLGNKHTTFIITSGWAMKLVNQDEPQIIVNKPPSQQLKPEPVKFTRHNVSLQAEIITGTIPRGDKRYSPNGWTGEIFEGNGTYKIRVIPNRKGTARAVIDIFISLGASSTGDLTMKYHAFAERYLGAWAEKHSLRLSQITEYRTPHT
ncbi:MAG: Lrp/AsnC family transcriptional regulator, partial [Rectinemataceae bacterium]|nr:Lrp/AsnC family transcriptional regulator [Rectinemataceae bacterium]